MPTDLPPHQSRAVADVMLRLHDDFRSRHGLPPLPTAWTLMRDLSALRSRAVAINRPTRSRRPLVGPVITAVRRLIWHFVHPVLNFQPDVNNALLLELEAIARDRDAAQHARHVLSRRITELERQLEHLRRNAT